MNLIDVFVNIKFVCVLLCLYIVVLLNKTNQNNTLTFFNRVIVFEKNVIEISIQIV